MLNVARGVPCYTRVVGCALALLVGGWAWADWPMFRHDPARSGGVAGKPLGALEAAWSAELGGSVDGSPAIVDGVVYVGNSVSAEVGRLYALDAAGGEERWRFEAGGALLSSPAVAAGLVMVGCADGFLYAVRAEDGQLAWRFRTRGPIVSSPAVVEGRVIFGSMDGRLYACSVADGAELWRTEGGPPVQPSPAVAGDTVLFGDDAGTLRGVALADGSERWRIEGEGRVVAAPVVGENVAVFGVMAGSALRPPKLDFIVAVDPDTGETAWTLHEAFSVLAAPIIVGDRVLFVTSEGYLPKAVLRAAAVDDGEVLWEKPVPGLVDSSPAAVGEHVCFGTQQGHLMVVSAEDGRMVQAQRLNSRIYSSPAFDDGRLYVGVNDGVLHCLRQVGAP